MEGEHAKGEDQQRAIAKEIAEHRQAAAMTLLGHAAAGLDRIDLRRADAHQCQQRRNAERSGADEDGLVGDEPAAGAHEGRSDAVADRGEAHIAAEPDADLALAGETQRDRRDGGAEHAARQRVHDLGQQHDREQR